LSDQHITAERALHEPQLYQYTLNGNAYRIWSYWINLADAIWQSAIIFFFAYYGYFNDSSIDNFSFGFSLVFSMMATSLIHVLIQRSRINRPVIISVVLSFLAFLVFALSYDAVCINCVPSESSYRVSYHTFRQGQFWFTTLLTIITAMLPRFTGKYFWNTFLSPLR
jgi:phospholipid-translocating ATPase